MSGDSSSWDGWSHVSSVTLSDAVADSHSASSFGNVGTDL
jgi:hypothetical protein